MAYNDRRPLPQDGRYACYLRRSREEQRQEILYGGDVLARHREMMEYTSKVNGHVILHFYNEVVSGELIAERPEMRALIEAVDSGEYDGLYVMAVDRLSRGTDQNTIIDLLETSGLFLITPSGYLDPWNVQDMDTIRYMLFQAINELRSYCRRMSDAICIGIVNGMYLARLAPLGFDKVQLPNGFKTIRPNKDAELVHQMFEWYAYEGLGYQAIANRLTEMGIPTATNSKHGWNKATVAGILKNETYIGVSVWSRSKTQRAFETDVLKKHKYRTKNEQCIRVKGEWEPIIEQELWDAVQERASKNLPVRNDRPLVNPLARLLFCAECGKAIGYRPTSSKKENYRWYRHPSVATGCHQKSSRDKVVLGMLTDALKAKIEEIEVCISDGRAIEEHARAATAVENLTALLSRLDRRDAKLIEMRSDGEVSAEEFRGARLDVADRRAKAQTQLDEAQATLDKEVDLSELKLSLSQAIDMLQSDDETAEDINRFLQSIIKRIEYSKPDDAAEPTLEVFFA